jgi:hypothetical protein
MMPSTLRAARKLSALAARFDRRLAHVKHEIEESGDSSLDPIGERHRLLLQRDLGGSDSSIDLSESFVFPIERMDLRSVGMRTLLKLKTSIFGQNGASNRRIRLRTAMEGVTVWRRQ